MVALNDYFEDTKEQMEKGEVELISYQPVIKNKKLIGYKLEFEFIEKD